MKISATTIFNHELDHAAGYDKDPKAYIKRNKPQTDNPYDNPEEQRVITGMEQKTALAMGEISSGMVTRKDHTALYAIKTIWPNSTVGTFLP